MGNEYAYKIGLHIGTRKQSMESSRYIDIAVVASPSVLLLMLTTSDILKDFPCDRL